ncbi:hypothetical protein PRZ48_007061 [Zasmidium cellare]|uniref:Uncharacterized protein n=1 Tax=Zasmidium cellare TaxID=395010 RepID=A0ABR0EIP6_ZASCE|nr:hypothetical protein PRZ48_007061 [Zasmidium cellare]
MKMRFPRKLRTPEQETAQPTKDIPVVRFHRDGHQNDPSRRTRMLRTPTPPSEDDERLNVEGVTDIARKMSGVAMFVKTEYCTGLQATSVPTQKIFKDLVDRILNYGWPLVSPGASHKLDLPGDKNILEAKDAAQTMEQLAGFFDREAKKLRETQLDVLKQVRIAKDLRFAARYTEALVGALPAVDGAKTPEQVEAERADGHEPLKSQGSADTEVEDHPSSSAEHQHDLESRRSAPEAQLQPVSKGLSFKGPYVVENVAWQPALASVEEDELSNISSSLESRAQTQTNDDKSADSAHISPKSSLDIPRELQGRRLTSRCWFESDTKFSDLIGSIKQWTDDAPDYEFTTIRGQRDLENLVHHFCDATPLGISALFIIKCEHPLDPDIVSHLDMDILRFVRLLLWDWTNGHGERRAERESLEVVRREIRIRKGEIAEGERLKAAIEATGGLGGGSSSKDPEPVSGLQVDVQDEQRSASPHPRNHLGRAPPPTPTSFDDDDSISLLELSANLETELQANATVRDSREEGLDLSAHWLFANEDTTDLDHWSIKEAREQPLIPVTLPTECTSRTLEATKTVRPTVSRESDDFNDLGRCSIEGAREQPPECATQTMEATKTVKASSSRDSDDFTTLLRRSKLAGLGVPTGPTQSLGTVSPKIVSLAVAERNARLEWENSILKEQLQELQEEIDSLRPLDSPPRGSRTDDQDAHPLQYLVGQRERAESPSMQADIDARSEDRLESDEDLKRYTSNDLMSLQEFLNSEPPPSSPSRDSSTTRWAHSFNDVFNRMKRSGRASRNHSNVYEGYHGAPHTYVPTHSLRSSKGRSPIHRPERENSDGGDPLNSGVVWPQPGGLSMREV